MAILHKMIGDVLCKGKLTSEAGRILNTTRIASGDSPYTALATDHSIFADTDGGAITVNLPAGVDGTEYKICNCGSSVNNLTVTANGAETIDQSNSQVLTDRQSFTIVFESTENWVSF